MTWKKAYRILAESYVLHCIGALHGDAEQRLLNGLQEVGAPYKDGAEFCDTFEAEESVTIATIEWLQAEWPQRSAANATLTPADFARDVANDVFIEIDF